MKARRITVFGTGILIAAISSSSLAATTQTGIASVYSGEQTANGEYAPCLRTHRGSSHSAVRYDGHGHQHPDGPLCRRPYQRSRPVYPGSSNRPDAGWRSGNRIFRARSGPVDRAVRRNWPREPFGSPHRGLSQHSALRKPLGLVYPATNQKKAIEKSMAFFLRAGSD